MFLQHIHMPVAGVSPKSGPALVCEGPKVSGRNPANGCADPRFDARSHPSQWCASSRTHGVQNPDHRERDRELGRGAPRTAWCAEPRVAGASAGSKDRAALVCKCTRVAAPARGAPPACTSTWCGDPRTAGPERCESRDPVFLVPGVRIPEESRPVGSTGSSLLEVCRSPGRLGSLRARPCTWSAQEDIARPTAQSVPLRGPQRHPGTRSSVNRVVRAWSLQLHQRVD